MQEVTFENQIDSILTGNVREMESLKFSAESGTWTSKTLTPRVYSKHSTADKNRKVSKRDLDQEPYYRYGDDNRFPFLLLDLGEKSHTHKRALLTVSNLAVGSGIELRAREGQELTEKQIADVKQWLRRRGINNSYLRRVCHNMAISGGCPIAIHLGASESYNGNGRKLKSLKSTYPIKFYKARVGKEDERTLEIERYWVSDHFQDQRVRGQRGGLSNNEFYETLKGFKRFRSYEESDNLNEGLIGYDGTGYFSDQSRNLGRYVYWINPTGMNSDVYPEVQYQTDSAINSMFLEEALASFDMSGMENGMMAGYIVTVDLPKPKNPKDETARKDYEDKKAAVRDRIQAMRGHENNEEIVVVYQDPRDKSQGITITPIPHNNKAEIHKIIEERKTRTILTAWGVIDERLIGVPPTSGKGLGSQGEMLKEAEDVWYESVIHPSITSHVEEFLNEVIMNIYSGETGQEELPFELYLKRKSRFHLKLSDDLLRAVFSVNEIRAMAGYAPATEEVMEELKQRGGNNNE